MQAAKLRNQGLSKLYIGSTNSWSPTPLLYLEYKDYNQYLLGIGDMGDYRAEVQVFGGVVLFNRGDSDHGAPDAYIRPAAPFLIFKLSDRQVEAFADSATFAPAPTLPEPLPFRTEKYASRINPDESMARRIFRNKYERKPIQGKRPGYRRRIRLEDQLEMMDHLDELKSK